ncbi:MAG TPA: hypothetical protein VFA26_07995, partial [Gemmataceae bacterium]|nr:hypothetical protein [Gemmataceae bacterium]
MPKPFDATLKDLVRHDPLDWAVGLDDPSARRARVLTPDLSTRTAFADLVLEVGRHLLHLEFQSSPDPDLPRRVFLYNALLHHHYGRPVHSVVVLLRPRADRGDLTGRLSYAVHPVRGGIDFRSEVVRLWQWPAAELLIAPHSMVPLAVLGRLPAGLPREEGLADVIRRMEERLMHEAPGRASDLLGAAYILVGAIVPRTTANRLFLGVPAVMESSTYRGLLQDGAINQARK